MRIRTLIVLGLAVLLVFAMSSTAMARNIQTYSGNSQGYISPPTDGSKPDYETYKQYLMPDSPHGDYSTSTNKCKVCHAVHGAGDGWTDDGFGYSAPRGSAADTEVLLRSTRQGACTYCHIGGTYSSLQPYGSLKTNYTTDTPFNHSASHRGAFDGCVSCHTVHGAEELILGGEYASSILLKQPQPDRENWPAATDLDEFCGACHDGTMPGETNNNPDLTSCYGSCHLNANHSENTLPGFGHEWTRYTFKHSGDNNASHTMRAPDPERNVAYSSSATCQSCHLGGQAKTAGNSFPHLTPGKQFLMDSYGYVEAGTGFGLAGGGLAAGSQAGLDQVCVQCHQDEVGGKEIGVGKTF
jgi:hypothetical protein